MIAKEIASYDILPLSVTDTISFALNALDENRVNQLPVVNEREYIGLVSEFDLVNHPDQLDVVGNVRISLQNSFVSLYQHVFDVMKMMSEMKLSVLPVVDQRNTYSGLITLQNLVSFLTLNISVLNPGGIIILEVSENDYSMSEISRIVESNDARIIGAFFTTRNDSTLIDLTLKINNIDLNPVIQTFERYNYTIKATFAEKDDLDDLRERYDSLMNYLNI
jgi:acetoin utilization protein AcuB